MIIKSKKPIVFVLTILLTFTLVCTVQPSTAWAVGETGTTAAGWMWRVQNDGTLAITGYNGTVPPGGAELEIDATLDTETAGLGTLSVTRIEDQAFYLGSWLKSITIDEGITSIGEKAFYNCSSITSITIPASIKSIGKETFSGCTGLTGVAFTSISELETIGNGAFTACSLIDNFEMPDSVVSVGERVFESCGSLSQITLSDNLENIGSMMFMSCPNLISITIPDSVTVIGEMAFGSNQGSKTGLTSIVIPDTVTSIGNHAFQYCSDLTSVELPENVSFTEIPSGLLTGCSSLTSVVIPPNVTTLGGSAFQGCSALTSVTIPNTVTSIGNGLFNRCINLSSITLPTNASMTSVPAGLAVGCTALESITIPANMTAIGGSAFSETGFQTFTVPEHVTSIGQNAFGECEFITSVNMSANVTNIGNYAFSECALLTNVTIPGISVTFGDYVFESSAIVGATGSGDGIYGLSGSTVQTYAAANSIPFISIGSVPEQPRNHGGGGSKQNETTEIKTTVSGNKATVNIPKAALELAADGNDALKLSTPVASLYFDTAALSTIFGEAGGDVKITVSRVDSASLPAETQQLVGDRPVFNFSVTSGKDTISEFGGNVTVAVPYTPKADEDPNSIVTYYINSQGQLEMVSNCAYDPATGTVSFTTDHFSQYAVGYNKVEFSDIKAGAWYENAVDFTAARGIVTGTGNGNYSPDGRLTRGQLLVMLMRAYGIEPDTDLSNNFSDAGNTYYTGYLAAAKRLDITEGLGNNLYAPYKQITRQEMFALLYNTLKVIGELPEGTEKADGTIAGYSDADSVASWAKDAVGVLAGADIIGGSNGKLSPKSTTTRAEMAQVLYNLLSR
ncbi:MAG: leucine-rich repeat protein [Bacillota bacterium]